jgi:hypothetical protein
MEDIYDYLETLLNKNVVRSIVREYACPTPTFDDYRNRSLNINEIVQLRSDYLTINRRPITFYKYVFDEQFCETCGDNFHGHRPISCELCGRLFHKKCGYWGKQRNDSIHYIYEQRMISMFPFICKSCGDKHIELKYLYELEKISN